MLGLTARVPTPLDVKTHRAPNGHGVLRPLPPAAHLLQLSGTAQQRGFAHGYLLQPQIVDWAIMYLLRFNMQGDVAWYARVCEWLSKNAFVPPSVAQEVEAVLQGMAAAAPNGSLHVPELGRDFGVADLHLINAYLEATPRMSSVTIGPWVCCGEKQPACSQFVAWGEATVDGRTIAARNMDGETDPAPGFVTVNDLLVMAVAGEGEHRFVSVMWPGHVGGLSLMNEAGFFAMLNVGSMGPGDIATNVTAIEYVMRDLAANLAANDATPQRVTDELNRYRGSLGGVSSSGANIVIARAGPAPPATHEATGTGPGAGTGAGGGGAAVGLRLGDAHGFVAELDRFGTRMRLPKPGEPFIAATNHFVSYGVDDKTDPSPDPQSPWRNFRLAVGRESYWRYQAVLETLRSRFRSAIPLGGLSAAGEVLKRAAHGSTEHSIAFDPQSLQIALAVAEPAASGAWDAPYSQWTTYTFEQLFSDGPGGGAENRSTCVPERPVQTGGAALGIFLTVGAIIAAIPQLLQLVKRRSSVGVSPFTLTLCLCYMTCNVCSTTLAKWSTLRACGEGAGCLLHLLDFTQQVAAGVAYVLILVAVTSFAPHDGRRTRLAVYSTMAALTVVIIVACVFASHSPCSTASRDLADGFASAAALVVLVAFVPQLVDTWRNAGRGSISYLFFTIQAVGCFLVATNELVVNHDPWTMCVPFLVAGSTQLGIVGLGCYFLLCIRPAAPVHLQASNADGTSTTAGELLHAPLVAGRT